MSGKLFHLPLIIGLGLYSSLSLANPFRSNYVCIPKVNPNEFPLAFKVREGIACAPDETLMRIYAGPEGAVLLYPSQRPLSPEAKNDLENYKRYMGIQ